MHSRNPFEPPSTQVSESDSPGDLQRPSMRRPATIDRAFWLILGSASLGFLPHLARGMHESPLIMMTLVMGFMFGFALTVGFAFFIRAGKNWARIVFLILFAIGSLEILPRVAGAQLLPAYVVVFVLQMAMKGYATWMMFSLPGSHWFSQDRKVRS